MFIDYLNQPQFIPTAIKILIACLFGGLIGLERGIHGRSAGLRTHILVCLGAAMTSVISISAVNHFEFFDGDVLRISAQVVSGIGFLGAGTILIRKDTVTGLTTTAGLWATATIGIAVGFGFVEAAALCTLLCIATTTILTKLEIKQKAEATIYIEIDDPKRFNALAEEIKVKCPVNAIIVTSCRSGIAGNLGMLLKISKKGFDENSFINYVLELENVVLAVKE